MSLVYAECHNIAILRTFFIEVGMKLTVVDGGYQCICCDAVVKTYSDYYKHYKEVHSHTTCVHCGRQFQRVCSCLYHEKFCASKSTATQSNSKYKGQPLADRPCQYCGYVSKYLHSLHCHENYCALNPNRIEPKSHKHTDATKRRISIKRTEYLKAHPEMHVWKRNDKFRSEPCEYLKSKLREIYTISEEYTDVLWSHNYSIDIAILEKKIAIEVNGNQHYCANGSLNSYYQTRHDYLTNEGWVVIELPYAKVYQPTILQELQQLIDSQTSIDKNEYQSLHEHRKISHAEKYQIAQKRGLIRSDGHINGNGVPIDEWDRRFQLILDSGVDLTKFGWVVKVEQKTGLTKRMIYNTVQRCASDIPIYRKQK